MNAPTVTSTEFNQIDLEWTAITSDEDTGNDPVIYYRVEHYVRPCYSSTDLTLCDAESDSLGSWVEVSNQASQGTLTTFAHTTLTKFYPSTTFYYKICAINGVGLGACSDTAEAYTVGLPARMDPPINVTVTYNEIKIKWNVIPKSAASGNTPITKYTI